MMMTLLLLWTVLLMLVVSAPAAPQPVPMPDDHVTRADFRMRISHENMLTPDRDLLKEGDTLSLNCAITLLTARASSLPHHVQWVFLPATDFSQDYDPDAEVPEVVLVDTDGFVAAEHNPRGLKAETVFAFEESGEKRQIESHLVTVPRVTPKDSGLYFCKILSNETNVVSSRHTLVSVLPDHSSSGSSYSSSSGRLRDQDEQHGPQRQQSSSSSGGRSEISERFMVVRRGMDVLLECRDTDIREEEVVWKKEGDPDFHATGKAHRLFRVDRWDSGVYYCTTNTTLKPHNNITVTVTERAPKIERDAPLTRVEGAVGQEVSISCSVDAIPVAKVVWYQVFSGSHSPQPSSSVNTEATPLVTASEASNPPRRRKLTSGTNHTISISGFKDGSFVTTLRIRHVSAADLQPGSEYVCEATNDLGKDAKTFAVRKQSPKEARNLDASSVGCIRISPVVVLLTVVAVFFRHV